MKYKLLRVKPVKQQASRRQLRMMLYKYELREIMLHVYDGE